MGSRLFLFARSHVDVTRIVFHCLHPSNHLGYAGSLLHPFKPSSMFSVNGRLYHPAPAIGVCGHALLSNSLTLQLMSVRTISICIAMRCVDLKAAFLGSMLSQCIQCLRV